MKKDVSQMTDEERSKLFPVILSPHNPDWKIWYEEEKQNILANVDEIQNLHHYGSTSIPNIYAKPTVDILAEIHRDADLNKIKQQFLSLDYHYNNFGREPSMLLVKGYTSEGFAKRVFHVHVYYKGLQEELLFRDYLITHPELAKEYEQLKLSLKDKYEFDRDSYTRAKYNFVKKVTDEAISEYKKAKA